MLISGLRTRFLVELIELYGEVLGPTEQRRLLRRLTERHRQWLLPNAKAGTRPEILFLDDVEEILWALEDAEPTGPASRFETAVTEVTTRNLARRTMVEREATLRGCLVRLIPIIEDHWPVRPPTITLEDVPSGLRLAMSLLGYSRCTRLLAFQLLGAIKAANRRASVSSPDELRTTMDFFGDRARIDIHLPLSSLAARSADDRPPTRRSSSPASRPLRPSLFEQVETILGNRCSSPPPAFQPLPSQPPPASRPSTATQSVPPRRSTQPAPTTLRSSPIHASPLSSPRVPQFDTLRPPASAPSNPKLATERPAAPSVPPPSRRGRE
jgi:hypothetical protein